MKSVSVLLSRHFQVVGFFLLALAFFLQILSPLQLHRFGNRSIGLSIQPFRKHDKPKGVQQAGTEKVYRSEEHTSELQSRPHLVCRLLLEKKNKSTKHVDDTCQEHRSDEHY